MEYLAHSPYGSVELITQLLLSAGYEDVDIKIVGAGHYLSLEQAIDACLHHNRPIQRPADDAVYRRVAGTIRPLRLGRGKAPLKIDWPFHLQKPLIATGGHMKNTLARAWDNRAVISPHIGDMGNAASLEVFEQTIRDLTPLYQIEPQQILCDAHPSYATTRWAERSGLPVHKVFHLDGIAALAGFCETASFEG
ncbi:MAG: hypothetical protein ACWA5X_07520 [bacterium]